MEVKVFALLRKHQVFVRLRGKIFTTLLIICLQEHLSLNQRLRNGKWV